MLTKPQTRVLCDQTLYKKGQRNLSLTHEIIKVKWSKEKKNGEMGQDAANFY